jgi:Leucine-rich repeat (LRR) protein/tetratricopeptide (TPR) repeat protein
VEEIARGGMGTVWRARQRKLNRVVALKLVHESHLPGESAARRFRIEAEASAHLRHRHIVTVYEVGEIGGRYFLSMELLAGGSLADRLRREPLSPRSAAELVAKVARAVQHAHEQGVLHRDLKPANILLDDTGEPRVSDFGLARLVESDHALTVSGQILGTPAYMSPEQARGEGGGAVAGASDVYGLGAILYEALTGQPPFSGSSQLEVLRSVAEDEPARPSSIIARVDRDLETICLKCLEKSPAARYLTALALAEDLERWLAGEPIMARSVTTPERVWKWARRHPAWAALWTTLALAILTVTVLSILAEHRMAAVVARLRAAAPAFQAQALQLRDEQKFAEAQQKIELAIALVPENADYHLLLGQMVQAQLRLPEAAGHFREVLKRRPGDRSATENLKLCEQLWPLNHERKSQLLAAMIAQQRLAESVLFSRDLGDVSAPNQLLINTRVEHLRKLATWREARIKPLSDGTWKLDLHGLAITELSFLEGLPISFLDLDYCPVSDLRPLARLPLRVLRIEQTKVVDLAPLRGMRLEELSIKGTKVSDLGPLAGAPLTSLSLAYNPITDLEPLRGMPLAELVLDGCDANDFSLLQDFPLTMLQARDTGLTDLSVLAGKKIKWLYLGNTWITNIEPLRGMPLISLDLGGCRRLSDLSPLTGAPALKYLLLPPTVKAWELIRGLPSLKGLGEQPWEFYGWSWARVPTAGAFLAAHAVEMQAHESVAALEKLLQSLDSDAVRRAARVNFDTAKGAYLIDLAGLPISDLSILAGLPIYRLELARTKVVDLSPLQVTLLESLNVGQTKVADLRPLTGCRMLRRLFIYSTPVTDLSPLAGLDLKQLYMPASQVRDLSPLAGLALEDLCAHQCPIEQVAPLLACPQLRGLSLDRKVPGLADLRAHPSLTHLDDTWNMNKPAPLRTVAEFWASFEKADSGSSTPPQK